ncbi:MAG: S-methyl-5-thioribose-1-phosphate isomerase [Mariprofundaceae bacterium]|nr:S-methyl-5-thioribose-1-phosphate isomerase [Mariprofundaceae bacterium]
MRVNGKQFRAISWHGGVDGYLQWIDQCQLPYRFRLKDSRDAEAVACAIESMEVRGAPAIGAMAAFGLALAFVTDRRHFESHWLPRFRRTRPTAVNLFHACDAMEAAAVEATEQAVVDAACAYADAEVERCRKIGEHLAEVLAVGERRILTHCNAGWLATVDWGTALSGIYHLARAGEAPSVLVDETRPRLQGARLTAWELSQEGVSCRIQADSAAAWMMAQGRVDAIVVGADRIAANGDVANKIGTYMLSLAAREHGVPLYVAAPESTFDLHCPTGAGIPIENRSDNEVLMAQGVDSDDQEHLVRIAASGVQANNPAFDVTPNHLIRAIISEQGLWRP